MSKFVEAIKEDELLPSQGKKISLEGKEIALFNVEGTFYAIDNSCAHMGGPLGEGELDGEIVTCPWHQWKYNVKTGVSAVVPSISVQKFNVKVENGTVFVEI